MLGAQQPEQDVLTADPAVATALGLLECALEAPLRRRARSSLVRRQLEETSTPLASIPTWASTRSKSRWIASWSSAESSPTSRRAAPAVLLRARQRDEHVLRLDARGPEPGGDRVGLERDLARLTGESLKHPAVSSRASCGRPGA